MTTILKLNPNKQGLESSEIDLETLVTYTVAGWGSEEILGRLIECLYEKNAIGLEQLSYILGESVSGYDLEVKQ